MATYNYKLVELDKAVVTGGSSLPESQDKVVEKFSVNNLFAKESHKLEIHVYSLDNTLLHSDQNFNKYSQLLNSAGAGKDGASNIYLDPILDAKDLGYERGDVRLLYNFLDNLYSDAKIASKFFIKELSGDRTEIRALTFELNDSALSNITENLKAKLLDSSFFSDYKLNFLDNELLSVINIDTLATQDGISLILKLANPLPGKYSVNDTFYVEEKVSDSVYYEIQSEVISDELKVPNLKGPNFSIEIEGGKSNSTEFLNYDELFSFPVTNSYFELRSLFNEKSAQISIDHSDYSDFVHFSSAEERLRNFKYKFDLINSYQDSIDAINSSSYADNGVSGSKEYYEGLIKGLVDNFDHYDNFLYFESGSKSWPKSTTTKPHTNYESSHISASSWFNAQIITASNYDVTNFDILTNTVPRFIREDSDNEPYLMFIHMVAQHFDNLWVYFKAVSDKYDADNRLDFGISKDLVRDAIESFGIKIFNSNQNIENLFSAFTGETPSTGSENIVSMSIATSASFNNGSTEFEHLQPVAKNNYLKEVYKRIYHNLPYLIKTKGTERGLRALINCFGLPDSIVSIKTFGGVNTQTGQFFGPNQFTDSSSLDKIRLDNTGSILTGSTLSRYTSIHNKDTKYTDDQPSIHVGFDISTDVNEFIDANISSSFNIDDYIGDPRDRRESKYESLTEYSKPLVAGGHNWEGIVTEWENAEFNWDDALAVSRTPRAFIRLLNFLDSSLFKVIDQFTPARSKVSTGAIIQSHKLHRSKIQQVSASVEELVHTGSLTVGKLTGSQGAGAFEMTKSYGFTTNYDQTVVTNIGPAPRNVTDESPMFTGEFSGSLLISTDGEVGSLNPFVGSGQPAITYDLTYFNLSLPLPPACVIALSTEYVGEFFEIFSTGSVDDSVSGSVSLTYPTTIAETVTSFRYSHDFDDYEFFTIQAKSTYYQGADRFKGWYTGPNTGSTLISTDEILSIYYSHEASYGNKIYAIFNV